MDFSITLPEWFIIAAIALVLIDIFVGTFSCTVLGIVIGATAALAKFGIIPAEPKPFLIAQAVAIALGSLFAAVFQKKIRKTLEPSDSVLSFNEIVLELNEDLQKGQEIEMRIDGAIAMISIDATEQADILESGTKVKVVKRSVGQATVVKF